MADSPNEGSDNRLTDASNKKVFARNLTYFIAQSGKTQKELADMLGVAQSTFNNWCTGVRYPRMDKVEKLANYFGIKKSDLIEDRVIEKRKKKVDVAVDIVVRLGADQQFCDAVKMLYRLDSKQLSSVTQLLSSFFRDGAD